MLVPCGPMSPPRLPRASSALGLLLLIGGFAAAEFAHVVRLPFYADDFLFLQKTREATFASLWGLQDLAFHYYRPWSRELQYWLYPRLFGLRELPFHLVALGLWIVILGLYFALARRLMGPLAASISVAGMAALASWSALVIWIAGLQELWMLAFALASLLAFDLRRTGWAIPLFVLALMSKETALVLPAVMLGHARLIQRLPWRAAVVRCAPFGVVAIAWAAFHPLLGGGLWHPVDSTPAPWHVQPGTTLARALLSIVNLDEAPRPSAGWAAALGEAAFGIVCVALMVAWGRLRRRDATPAPAVSSRSILAFGALWVAAGWLPLLQPTVPWIAYYALLGCFGAWLIAGHLLAGRPWIAIALVCALGVVRAGRSMTPSNSWGSESYQMRAANFVRRSRDDFKARQPTFPPHSRIYLYQVPGAVGLVPGGERSIVFQVWYGDTTLWTAYASRYHARRPEDPPGTDYFYRYERGGWVQDAAATLPEHPSPEQLEAYADHMFTLREFSETLAQYLRLTDQHPDRVDYVFNVGSCYYRMGDSVEAARWYQRAASLPDAPENMKKAARRMRRFLSDQETEPPR